MLKQNLLRLGYNSKLAYLLLALSVSTSQLCSQRVKYKQFSTAHSAADLGTCSLHTLFPPLSNAQSHDFLRKLSQNPQSVPLHSMLC